MVKKLLRNSSGKLLFEGPGDLLYEEGEGGACCIEACQDEYYSTININAGTCGDDCTLITGQTLTRVGSTCQWTATQGIWTHETGCDPDDGSWRYKVWSGGVGGTLCASWVYVGAGTPTCPPDGSTEGGGFIRAGGACTPGGPAGPDEFELVATAPVETKQFFGLDWTNGETKLFDGTYNSGIYSENWKWFGGPSSSAFTMSNYYGGSYNPGNVAQFFIRDYGPYQFSLSILATPYGSSYSSNISTQWMTQPQMYSMNYGNGTIGTNVWGTVGSKSQIKLNSGETIQWWRNGNDTNVTISW